MLKTYLKTYGVIVMLQTKKGFPPTIAEIADMRGISETAARKHVEKLVEWEVISREEGKGRTITAIL